MSYPTPREVREALRATAPGTVLWEGRLEQTEIDGPSALFGMVPPLRRVEVGPRGQVWMWTRFVPRRDGSGRTPPPYWVPLTLRGNRNVRQFALSRHGLCAPPVGWEEVVL
jgi:hypothetical protein